MEKRLGAFPGKVWQVAATKGAKANPRPPFSAFACHHATRHLRRPIPHKNVKSWARVLAS